MPITKELPELMNGFKVLKDLGRADNDIRYALVLCKECNKKFETSVYHINKIKSCGCLPIRQPKELEKIINGFKIIKDLGYENGSRRALAICKVCSREYEVDPNKLRYRKNCGCIKHGSRVSIYAKSHKKITHAYQHMMGRCYRNTNKDYYNYGGRGIEVCKEWKGKINVFCKWAIESSWEDGLSLDRIDSNGNYEPNNCRWVDAATQARNTRRNVLTLELAQQLRKDRKTMKYHELVKKYNVSYGTVAAVISYKIWRI